MKVPLSWLKEVLPLTATPIEISEALTLLGIEVEKIDGLSTSFSNVVVGKVISAEQHPNADRLRVTRVTDGTAEYQVVCGAPNCRAGLTVAFARVGAELTDRDGKKWKIKKSKIRDVESEGMLCSAQELQLSDEHEGILELANDASLGADFASYVTDPIFDISLTPNLGHCLSIVGIARELAAVYKIKTTLPPIPLHEKGRQTIDVKVDDPALCPRYACRIVTGVKVGPSPLWLQERLTKAGLRPINNLVDIGNYVMLELGQPLHIFDLDQVRGPIEVKTADTTTELETLDHQVRQIPPHTLLITDKLRPLAIAGVMGGLSSATTEKTSNILIEAAVFNPTSIRKACRHLDLKSDSSYRFERGVDGAAVVNALNRAATLIEQLAGGEIHPLVDVKSSSFTPKTITCRLKRLTTLLGFSLSVNEVVDLFHRLEMRVTTDDDSLQVTPPTYRNDITTEIDLVEEIARLYGYNNIPREKPIFSDSSLLDTPLYLLENQVKTLLLEHGLQECVTCDLISPTLSKVTMEKGLGEAATLQVLHPRSVDQSVLRTSLLPGLLQVVQHNMNHQIDSIAAFEVGRIHFRANGVIEEPSCAGIVLTGATTPHQFDRKKESFDFFDLKGVIENLCERLRISRYSFEPSHLHTLHPWRQAQLKTGGMTLGVMGEIHPQLLAQFDIHTPVYFAEIHLPDLLEAKKKPPLYSPLPQFPASERDWTLTLPTEMPLAKVVEAIQKTKSPFLETYYLLDLYTSDQLGNDRKNVTLRFVYRDVAKTISYEAVDQEHQKLTHSVAEKLGICL